MSKIGKKFFGFVKILKLVKTRLRRVFTNYPLIAWGTTGLIFIIFVSTSLFLWSRGESGSRFRKTSVVKSEHGGEIRRAIDGAPLKTKEEPRPLPLAVVIDNHPDARPVSGITSANLVWEAPVEGGLTRLMAVFGDGADVKKIGPVRSARPYFLDWAAELDAPLVHVGGSPEALALIRQKRLLSLDEFGRGAAFWRDGGRLAPHSTYTSSELLTAEAAKLFKTKTVNFDSWRFADSPEADGLEKAREVVIPWNGDYKVNWRYDEARGRYLRMENGSPERDEDGVEVSAANVAVLFTSVKVIDEQGRRRVETLGTGDSIVFSGGAVRRGTWRKDKPELRTRFFNEQAQEIVMRPGPTWVEVAPKGIEVKIAANE